MVFQKFWDPDQTYTDGFLKEYAHWLLEVSYHQHTLGSFIIFAKRSVEKFSALTPEELVELPLVQKEIEHALIHAFHPDRFNYLQLGNGLKQLHFHGVPRYKDPVFFAGRNWEDKTFGQPPAWSEKEESKTIVTSLRDHLIGHLAL